MTGKSAVIVGGVSFLVALAGIAGATAGSGSTGPATTASAISLLPASDRDVPVPALGGIPLLMSSASATDFVIASSTDPVDVIPAEVLPPAPTVPPAPPVPAELPLGPKNFRAVLGLAYSSPWYDGAHRYAQGFGCTTVPLYAPDPSCPDGQGFHHGLDISMPTGTPIYSAVEGTVVVPHMGPAYGKNPLTIRTANRKSDIVLGHLSKVVVHVGDVVHPGDLIGYSGDEGNSEGPHLHLEVRPAGGGDFDAVNPFPQARLQR